jgi:esterase/lipase
MRKLLAALGLLAAGAGCVFVLGPRVNVSPGVKPAPLPASLADLDAHLAAEEARHDDLIDGAEAVIRWARTANGGRAVRERTPLAVVYLHGFSATRQETAPLADTVAARLGANLFYARLTGHGRSGAALGEATATDWLRDARTALAVGRMLGERVVLVGTSTGGTLATWLATQPDVGDALAALVLVSPNFRPADPNAEILTWPWGRQIARAVLGTERTWEPESEAQARYWTQRYPTDALVEMMALMRFVQPADLARVTTPTLVLVDPLDTVVSAEVTRRRFRALGAARKTLVEVRGVEDTSHHVLAGDILSPATTEPLAQRIVAFVEGA